MYDLRGNTESPTGKAERPELPKPFVRHEPEEYEEKNHAKYWVAVAVLALAIAGLGWYCYPTLKQVPGMLAKFPALQSSLETMNARLSGAEGQIKAWGSEQQQLQDDFAKAEKSMAVRVEGARRQMQGLGDKIYQRVHGEVVAQKQVTDIELARLRSAGEADRASVEKLQTELATLREESAKQAEQLRNVKGEMERDGANRDQQLVSLNDQVGRESHDLEGLNQKLAVKRVDFEITRNHSQQLTEELSLGITGTDISHRRVTGWMWVMPDRRTIWLHRQGAQQPVVFYGTKDGKRRELVITNVAKNSVTGYVLLPGDGGTTATTALSKGD